MTATDTPAGTHKNLVAEQAVRGLHELPYFVPTFAITTSTPRTATSRSDSGVRPAARVNVFYLESFIDELAHAAGKDPYEYRRELIARNTKFRDRDDWLKALDMVAEMSGWGTPLPEGWARGIAIDDRRRPSRKATVALCAEVVTVSMSRGGLLRLERVDVVFDEGFSFVNPLSVRKQIEGQIAWALERRDVAGNHHQGRAHGRGQLRQLPDRPHGGLSAAGQHPVPQDQQQMDLRRRRRGDPADRARHGAGDLQDHRQAHPLASVRETGSELGLSGGHREGIGPLRLSPGKRAKGGSGRPAAKPRPERPLGGAILVLAVTRIEALKQQRRRAGPKQHGRDKPGPRDSASPDVAPSEGARTRCRRRSAGPHECCDLPIFVVQMNPSTEENSVSGGI